MTSFQIAITVVLCILGPLVVVFAKRWRYYVPAPNREFVNQTPLTDIQLRTLWVNARNRIGTQPFNLAAAANVTVAGTLPNIKGPDARALTMEPRNIRVMAVSPVVGHTYIKYPGGGYCNGYTDGPDSKWPVVHFSSVFVGTDTASNDNGIGYEFDNIIIARLGYNVEAR